MQKKFNYKKMNLKIRRIISDVFLKLTETDKLIQNRGSIHYRKRILLLRMLAILITLTLIGVLATSRMQTTEGQTSKLLVICSIIFLVAFITVYLNHYELAVTIVLLTLFVLPFASWYFKNDYSYDAFSDSFVWILLVVLLSNVLQNTFRIILLMFLNFITMLLLPVIFPDLEFSIVIKFVLTLLPLSIIIIIDNFIKQKDISTIEQQFKKIYSSETQSQRSYSLISALSKVASRVESTSGVEEIYKFLENELRRLDINYFVALLDQVDQTFVLQHVAIGAKTLARAEMLTNNSAKGFRIPRKRFPFHKELIEQQQPQSIDDVVELVNSLLPNFPTTIIKAIAKLAGINTNASTLYLPLITKGRTIGFLAVWGEKIIKGDIPIFSIFAAQVASAIRVSELFDQAQVANQAKTEFLSRMSHELRTPLNAILGFAQLMELSQKDPLTDGQRKHVHQIVEGGQHLLNLTNEILDLSRIETGNIKVSLEPVRIRDAMREACELAKSLSESQDIQVEIPHEPDGSLYVLADQQRLKQVCLNLMSNAVKYNHRGGSVVITHQERPGHRLRIFVRDTGPGIPPEKLGQIFTPFERLGAENSEVEGTGLGLALSKHLVEQMNGEMGVESIVGEGSTFWIELPIIEDPLENLSESKDIRGGILHADDFKVLYIEDNPVNFKLVNQILAEYPQAKLLGETRAGSGIELAREQNPDVILLDLHLPDMNGQEVLKRLKSDDSTSSIPVVVLSADASPGRVEELTKLGAKAYLTKPLNVKYLINKFDEILKEREYLSDQGYAY